MARSPPSSLEEAWPPGVSRHRVSSTKTSRLALRSVRWSPEKRALPSAPASSYLGTPPPNIAGKIRDSVTPRPSRCHTQLSQPHTRPAPRTVRRLSFSLKNTSTVKKEKAAGPVPAGTLTPTKTRDFAKKPEAAWKATLGQERKHLPGRTRRPLGHRNNTRTETAKGGLFIKESHL